MTSRANQSLHQRGGYLEQFAESFYFFVNTAFLAMVSRASWSELQ